jgi:uncharacterized membrane protein YphA (DoxX/SURF4 family)
MINTNPFFLSGVLFSAMSFLFYGWGCIFSARIGLEFVRYQLDGFRRLVGGLQLAGSAGLIGGLWVAPLGAAAAIGLAILMAMGLAVRLRLKDTPLQMSPALMYLLLNGCLAVAYVQA